MDKTFGKAQNFEGSQKSDHFEESVSLGERLQQSWFLTCAAFGINPLNPPKMDKSFSSTRKQSIK